MSLPILLTPRLDTADAADHAGAATAIAKGIAAGHSADRPGYWIHVSGTAILMWHDIQGGRFGEGPIPEHTYRDIDDIDRIVTLPESAPHGGVDKIVREAASDVVKTAIVSPPTIYGTGSGTGNTRSIQVPGLVYNTLDKGFAPIAGAGLTEWDHVHIDDLGEFFVKIAEASQNPSLKSNPEVFGRSAYYFLENGIHKWSDVARWIAQAASKLGYLPEATTKTVTQQEAAELRGVAVLSWGWNSHGVAQRARKYLGWQPKGESLKDHVASLVPREAALQGVPAQKK